MHARNGESWGTSPQCLEFRASLDKKGEISERIPCSFLPHEAFDKGGPPVTLCLRYKGDKSPPSRGSKSKEAGGQVLTYLFVKSVHGAMSQLCHGNQVPWVSPKLEPE